MDFEKRRFGSGGVLRQAEEDQNCQGQRVKDELGSSSESEREHILRVLQTRNYRHWTKEEDGRLKELREKGKTWAAIAFELRRENSSCKHRYVSLTRHYAKGKWTPEEDKIVMRMRDEGKSWRDISEAINRPPTSIRTLH